MDFNTIVERRLTIIRRTLIHKAKEYASDENRFHNFDVAARMDGITPEQALLGMMRKHEVSVRDLINDPNSATNELINEKIGDNINYLILLEGLLRQRIGQKEDVEPDEEHPRWLPSKTNKEELPPKPKWQGPHH